MEREPAPADVDADVPTRPTDDVEQLPPEGMQVDDV